MGGNKARRQGRKFNGATGNSLRVAKEDGEMYAVVTKMFGGSRMEVMCADRLTRICIMRNKFRGRNRRDNRVSIGTLCLVGLRTWETSHGAGTVDLLHVYTQDHASRLVKDVAANWSWLDEGSESGTPEMGYTFASEEQSVEDIVEDECVESKPAMESEDIISVDDI